MRWALVTLIDVFVLGCTPQAPPAPIVTPAERLEFDGFSVLPPPENNWYRGRSPSYGVVFMKRFRQKPKHPEMHTFYAAANRHDLATRQLNTRQDLMAFVEWTFRAESRFHVMTSNVVFDDVLSDVMGADCARYDFVEEEHDNPIFPKTVLILTAHGFQCRHPSSASTVINAGCSERYPKGEHSLLDESLREECQSFLRSVQLKPLAHNAHETFGTQAGSIAETKTIPEVWEPARWKQMIRAAKKAREQGRKSEAERFCAQALPYVDASTTDGLYKYAALLKELNRVDADVVHARANKLREAQTQLATKRKATSVYLGFVPSEELKKYADLLQELHRDSEAEAMRALADAHRYAQLAYAHRTLLLGQGRDPRGECSPESLQQY